MKLSSISARSLARPAALVGATGLLALGVAAPASAHVSVSPSETGAGAYSVLTFSVPHGCDGKATTKIDISIPEGINSVTPTRNPYYDVAEQIEPLDPPVSDAHGNEVTERTSTVTYTATDPLPDGLRDTLELSLQLPEDAAGQTLAFPVIQTCTEGETAWTEVVAEGADEPEYPAPVVTVTEATGGHHGDEEATESEEHDGHAGADADDGADDGADNGAAVGSDDDGNGLAVAGLVAGVAGILVGGAALARSRRA